MSAQIVQNRQPEAICHEAPAPTGRVIYDWDWAVYRLENPDGSIVGAEYGGYPLGWDSRADAVEMMRSRAELAADLAARRVRLGRAA